VAADLTKEVYGKLFAVLNMANGSRFGGGYVEGTAAQEENMFRRTDCHFADEGVDHASGRYSTQFHHLINAAQGSVYLDTRRPRVCIRGPEDGGYAWHSNDEIFPFLELRAAAVDLSKGGAFDLRECRRRIDAQLDTLIVAGVRHVVLSAFGCGAFANPAVAVARCYREALELRRGAFDVVAFAIYHAGYGPDNFALFEREFRR